MTPQEMEQRIRDLEAKVLYLTANEVNMAGRRLTHAGKAIQPGDYITKAEVETAIEGIEIPQIDNTFSVINVQTRSGFPKVLINQDGLFIYDINGTAVFCASLKAVV